MENRQDRQLSNKREMNGGIVKGISKKVKEHRRAEKQGRRQKGESEEKNRYLKQGKTLRFLDCTFLGLSWPVTLFPCILHAGLNCFQCQMLEKEQHKCYLIPSVLL